MLRKKGNININTVRKLIDQKSKSKRVFPKSRSKWYDCITEELDNATPRKLEMLKDSQVIVTPKSKKTMEGAFTLVKSITEEQEGIKRQRNNEMLNKRFLLAKIVNRAGNPQVKRAIFKKSKIVSKKKIVSSTFTRKTRSDKISEEEEKRVIDFYRRPDNVTMLPLLKHVNKHGEAKGFLTKITKILHGEYSKEYGSSICLRKFQQFRPNNIKPSSKTLLVQCCCETCINIEEKVKAIKEFIQGDNIDGAFLRKATMCQPEPTKDCIYRKCTTCGVECIDQLLCPDDLNKSVTWKKWESIEIDIKEDVTCAEDVLEDEVYEVDESDEDNNPKKESDKDRKKEKKAKRKPKKVKTVLSQKTGTLSYVIKELKRELHLFPMHVYTANHQQKQYSAMKKSLKKGQVLAILDFAENYRSFFQNEIQSAHWNYSLITLHSSVAYFLCTCGQIMTEVIGVISNDLKHDFQAVQAFEEKLFTHLETHPILGTISKVFEFTDGARSQYKSYKTLTALSLKSITYQRNFFGSRHGKR